MFSRLLGTVSIVTVTLDGVLSRAHTSVARMKQSSNSTEMSCCYIFKYISLGFDQYLDQFSP